MIPVVDLTRIVEWVKNAGADIVKWIALRTLLLGLVSTVVPLAIYKAWMLISEQIISYTSTQMGSGDLWSGSIVEFTGLASWLAIQFRFQECFTILSTALIFKFALGFIKR